MTSTQRLIILVIGMNLLFGFMGEFWESQNYADSQQLQIEQDKLEQLEMDFESAEGVTIRKIEGQDETTYGNAVNWGFSFWGVFARGLNPLSINPLMYTNVVEQIVSGFLLFFRNLVTSLLLFEAYLVYKNKKGT